MPLADTSSTKTRRIITVVGMAMVWPSLFNQTLYPLTFAFNKEAMPSLFLHYILYAFALLVVTMVILIMRETATKKLFASRTAVVACGLAGAVGIILLVVCDFSSIVQSILFATGIILYALFVPTHFIFWSYRLLRQSEKRAGFDLLLSLLVFCGITIMRLTFSIHAWPFAIAYPCVAAILAGIVLSTPRSNSYPLRQSTLQDYAWKQLGLSTLFVYIASISVWLLDSPDALFNYPPRLRVFMYAAIALALLVLCAMYRPRAHSRSKADIMALAFCTILLVAGILLSGIGERVGASLGNFPLLTGLITFEVLIWLRLLVSAQVKHLGIVRPAAFYLIIVIGGSNLVCTMLLYGNQLLLLDASSAPTLVVTVASAFIILLIINVLMVALLYHQVEATRVSDIPCEAAIDSMLAEEAALQRIRETFYLSQRETDTLRLAAHNKSAKAIAEELYVAESTVNSHIKSIYRKTDVHSRADLIALVNRFMKDGNTQ